MNNDTNLTEGIALSSMVHALVNDLGWIPHSLESIAEKLNELGISDNEIIDTLVDSKKSIQNSLIILSNQLKFFRTLQNLEDTETSFIQVNPVIQECLKSFVENKKLNRQDVFKLNLAKNLPSVKINKQALILSLSNLIDNAVQAIRDKTDNAQIEIKSYLEGDFVVIDVVDNGVGIPQELREKIFNVGLSTKASGHGLGLWLSRNLMTKYGASLSFISNKRKTIFRIQLIKGELTKINSKKRKVLIVEDELQWQRIIRKSLIENEFEVYSATEIENAISLIKAENFDVALLDLNLGKGINGLEIARIVREYNPEALIMMISAFIDVTSMKEAFDIGVDNFISKGDISITGLLSQIDEGLLKKIEDATQQQETRRESLRQTQQDKFIYETLSTFSHELRDPLLIAKRNAELLMSGKAGELNKKQNEIVEALYSSINREFTLLNTHLDLSRIERGLESLNYISIDLVKLMKEEISAHKLVAQQKNIVIKSSLPKKEAFVRIDIHRFRAALNPLMNNAIKFSGDGSTITISVKLKDDYVEVHISDEGPGIKPEELDRLLGRNISSNTVMNQRIRASGLGLSLAKRVIEDYHDGKLWFIKKAEGERGTTVAFRLSRQK